MSHLVTHQALIDCCFLAMILDLGILPIQRQRQGDVRPLAKLAYY